MTTHYADNSKEYGDPEHTFRCIVLQYQRRITAFATRMMGGDEATAQDIAQETFLALWRQHFQLGGSKSKFPLPEHMDRYLLRITHNRCIDQLRVRRDSVTFDPERDFADPATNPHNATQAQSLSDAVRNAVAQLSEGQRATFILSHYDGLRYQEIADLLDCPIGTVASRKNQAVMTLRRLLKAWNDDTENENPENYRAPE